ncbi:hypothetical protein YC2023_116165 [Brassica napus]
MIGLLKVFWITRESYPINYSKCWKQQRGLLKSMDPDSEVKAMDGLLRDNLKDSGNRKTELDKSSMEELKD